MRRFLMTMCALFVLCSAVSAVTFVDFDQVDYPSAVVMLTDLGVLSGYEDGTFRPNNTMSRAEISKVMTLLDTNEMSASDGLSFVDTADSWAVDYIEYCADAGIISGSDGYFRPDDNLTVRELLKMLLVVVGLDEEPFTGSDWGQNVEDSANSIGLLNGYSGELDRYVTRENAAFLINNALQCDIILDYDENGQPVYNLDEMYNPKSLLETRFDAVLVQGVVEANGVHDLRTGYNKIDEDCIHISGYVKDFKVSPETALDNGILGHKITIYAIFGTDYNQIVGTVDSYSAQTSIYIDEATAISVLYDNQLMGYDANTIFYMDFVEFYQYQLEANMEKTVALTMVDHEGDGKLEYLFLFSMTEDQATEDVLVEFTQDEDESDQE